MNKFRKVLFFSALFFAGIFCFNINNVWAVNVGDVVINEIAWMGTENSANDEWIEIYNNTNQDIDLSGWILSSDDGTPNIELSKIILANGYFLLERTDDTTVDSIAADLIYTGALNDDGEYLKLKNSNGEVVDEINASGDWVAGDKVKKATMERTNGGWQTSALVGGTPKAKNSGGQNDNNSFAPKIPESESQEKKFYSSGDVVVNEIVSDPEDGPEWIELYNKTSGEIDLNGWRIEDGSEAQTVLEGKISGYGYLVIEGPKGNLNNKGDVVFLFDCLGNIIDQIAYGNWNDGNINDNAPKSSDPNGIGRIGASQDTNNDLADFQVIFVLTPNAANILVDEKKEEEPAELSLKNKIIINEIFPNPKGDDGSEFIELKNVSDSEINLSGFLVGDNSNRRYKIKEGKIKSGDFFVVSRIDSKIALNNTGGDKAVLYDEKENVIDEVEYLEKAPDDKSCILFEGAWEWTDKPSMGAVNVLMKENQSPVAVIDLNKSDVLAGEEFILDASDSYDPEGENLILEWQADGLLYHDRILKLKFDKVGSYEIKITLSDGEKKTVETRLVNVLPREGSATSPNLPGGGDGSLASIMEAKLPSPPLINEFLPNPEGSDDGEFIELFNSNNIEINLKNFYLDDGDGGSGPYQIKENIILKPFSYFVFERALTKLALNNTGDAVRLLDENKNVLEQINYSDVVEGASFSREFDGNWFWTKIVTKGTENQIEFVGEDSLAVGGQNEAGLLDAIDLSEVRGIDLGERIRTRGVVAVLPGVLGSQVFYISGMLSGGENQNPPTPLSGGASSDSPLTRGARGVSLGGIQIYSYKKNFPKLNIGNEIEVIGILSQSGGEHRLKISQKDDIKILGYKDNIEPIKITADEIDKESEGSFVLVEGEIIEISGSSIFIDDGSGEAKVFLKESSGVKKTDLKEGDVVSVAGIVSQTSSGFRLLPRSQDDIKKVEALGIEFAKSAVGGNSSEIMIESRNSDWLKYITAGLGAVVLILGVVCFRMRRKKKFDD